MSRAASDAANWLARQWVRVTDKASTSSFMADRRQEVLDGTFDASYWHTCPLLSQTTQYAEPTILPFAGVQDPNYYNPNRQPTQSGWSNFSAEYPTPSFPTLPPQPSPGFEGEVAATYFTDLWLAQQVFLFSLPASFTYRDLRPVMIQLAATIQAQSSHQGNRAWFTLQHRTEFHDASHAAQFQRMLTWYERHHLFDGDLPAPNPNGWSHEVEVSSIRSHGTAAQGDIALTWNRLTLTVAVPPTQGRYFSDNDWVRVAFDAHPTLYLARKPTDIPG